MIHERLGGPVLLVPRAFAAIWRRIALHVTTVLHRLTLGALGGRSRVQPGVRFMVPQQVFIGKDCLLWTGVEVSADGLAGPLRLGDRVEINAGVHLDTSAELVIGDDVLISEQAVIYTHDHGLDPHSTPVRLSKVIGEGAWIGMRAVILPGCRSIGRRAVIGAGAVVTRDVPDGAVVAGNPARIVSQRDDSQA